ncbi:unnamed protein product [Hymenolepis diminuta]|uniref:EF-hand domain-containing protein n=1 Tax=Hymenolepis diminuta TaxID=6216 RepID=A0A564YEA1_HYMDI|nr:unnamed protein product [Hymenolepis diminuta]
MSESVFKDHDKDNKGKIAISSAIHALQLLDQAPTEKQLQEVIDQIDSAAGGTDGNCVNFETFTQILRAIYLPPDQHFKRLLNAFAELDEKDRGILSKKYLSELLLTRGDALTKKQIKELMSESSTGGDGYFAYIGFANHLLDAYSKFQQPKKSEGRKKTKR